MNDDGQAVDRAIQDRLRGSIVRPMLQWSEKDPREHFDKRGSIVIWTGDSVCTAEVETKHGYSVWFSQRIILPVNESHPAGAIGPGEEWPKGWKWIPAPK